MTRQSKFKSSLLKTNTKACLTILNQQLHARSRTTSFREFQTRQLSFLTFKTWCKPMFIQERLNVTRVVSSWPGVLVTLQRNKLTKTSAHWIWSAPNSHRRKWLMEFQLVTLKLWQSRLQTRRSEWCAKRQMQSEARETTVWTRLLTMTARNKLLRQCLLTS